MKQLIPAFAGIPTIYWSSPGQGKSSAIESIARKLDYHCETLVLSQRDPSDVGGIPFIKNGRTVFAPPDWLERLEKAEKSILFFDELTTARPSVQAPALTLIQSRKIHSFSLPDSTIIIAASNPPEEAADGSDLEPPMANRFCHLDWKMDLNTWTNKLLSNFESEDYFDLPKNWKDGIQDARNYVASFLNLNSDLANKMPEDRDNQGKAWASYRSWTNAATVIAASESLNEDPFPFIAGCVGESAAIEFVNWKKTLDLPDPEEILRKPRSWKISKRDDISMLTINSVINRIRDNNSEERWNKGWEVLEHLCQNKKSDIAVMSSKNLKNINKNYGIPKIFEKSLIRKFVEVRKSLEGS